MNIQIRRFRLAKGLKPTQLICLGGSMMFQRVGNNSYPGQPCSNGGTYFRSLFFWLYQLVIYNIIKFTHSSKTSPFVLVTLELKIVFVPHIFNRSVCLQFIGLIFAFNSVKYCSCNQHLFGMVYTSHVSPMKMF